MHRGICQGFTPPSAARSLCGSCSASRLCLCTSKTLPRGGGSWNSRSKAARHFSIRFDTIGIVKSVSTSEANLSTSHGRIWRLKRGRIENLGKCWKLIRPRQFTQAVMSLAKLHLEFLPCGCQSAGCKQIIFCNYVESHGRQCKPPPNFQHPTEIGVASHQQRFSCFLRHGECEYDELVSLITIMACSVPHWFYRRRSVLFPIRRNSTKLQTLGTDDAAAL